MVWPWRYATSVPSAPILANFNDDARIIAPFSSNIRKPLTLSTRKDLYIDSGYRRQFLPGNPVLVGSIRFAGFDECEPPFCVTADTDDNDNVTLTVQKTDGHGCTIPVPWTTVDSAMVVAKMYTQSEILRLLEVGEDMWKRMIEINMEQLSILQPSVREKALTVRDHFLELYFMDTVIKYVLRTMSESRAQERERFMKMASEHNGLEMVYMECGWLDRAESKDLAKTDPVKLAKEYDELCLKESAMEELPMQPL